METSTASSRLANDRPTVLIANPDSRRAELFAQSLARLGAGAARVIAWADLLRGRVELSEHVPAGAVVKVDSPGKDFAVEKLILAAGAESARLAGLPRAAAPEALERIRYRKGEILFPSQWYAGFCRTAGQMHWALADAPAHFLMNDLNSSQLMFDKPRCHRLLRDHGIPVPRAPAGANGSIGSHAELIECMIAQRMPRVFVKLAYGSSGSGVVAFQIAGGRQQATTTVEMEWADGVLRLFNSRNIRTYTDSHEIRVLIDELCAHGVHVEQWIPKAGIAGKTFDLRIVAIAGEARFIVVRMSKHPITNLHLLNERGDSGPVRQRMGPSRWDEMLETCRRIAALFPRCLYVAIDMLIGCDFKAHAVLELNAFGDLLPGITDRGEDVYAAEINACGVPA